MMKRLTLIRHAKSSHDNPGLRDFNRPLNHRGLRDAPKMGRYLLNELAWHPDQIISSPATRAITTARLIAQEVGYDALRIRQAEEIYEANLRALFGVIHEVDESVQHLTLVGHNPGMEFLANTLVGQRSILALVTCGVVLLELNVSTWASVREKCATLQRFLQPKALWGEDV